MAILLLCGSALGQADTIDLGNAVVVAPTSPSGPELKAVQMLVEEVEKRTGILWTRETRWPKSDAPVICVLPQGLLKKTGGPYSRELAALPKFAGAEGFQIRVTRGKAQPAIFVLGNDSRGVLFGVGRLLRELHMDRRQVAVEADLNVATAPKYPLRGHQLGYRPKCNSYDAWDLPVWEQYFRDLAVFGCNAIELIPPRSDDDADSPHFPKPQMEMMVGMSRVAASYGLDVWVWYPAMDKDYTDPTTVNNALREWSEVLSKLPRVDAVFVPGGDPGHTQPGVLLSFLQKQTENLHLYHPKAQMWVSPQSFNQAWFDEFVSILKEKQPAWLSGVVYGPQVRVTLAKLREVIPAKYPIRHYPDITHSRQCQFPVPNWDVAYALTEGRECINPRPVDQEIIFRHTQPYTIGFLTYSEGCNDDVNKAVWSALGWDPQANLTNILQQYGCYFISERQGKTFGEGLFALEKNWRGSLAVSTNVENTLALFQELERNATPAELRNWRFQQAMFRAYYDAYTRKRLVAEKEIEREALACLQKAPETGAADAMAKAEQTVDRPMSPPNPEWRNRIVELAEALFQSIGMQLSVERYQAVAVDRGASLDTLDFPLNDRIWLKEQFAAIRQLPGEPERLRTISDLVSWTAPGPGNFYDDLGSPGNQPRLQAGLGFERDPCCFVSPRVNFEEEPFAKDCHGIMGSVRRLSWCDHAEALYDGSLSVAYEGLDPQAKYHVRVVYAGDNEVKKQKLVANGTLELHSYLGKPLPYKPREFPLPQEATRSGKLTLTWSAEPGLGGNGRGCQVSEVWLLKQP